MKVGVIGLGIIGSRMARRWKEAGHEVLGWNRTRSHAEGLDIPLAATPASLARNCDVLMIVVADPPALERVISGPDGLTSIPLTGRIVMNASTVDAAANRKAEAAIKVAGGRFLETPFTGSKLAAEQGRIVFYVGGDRALLQQVEPLLMQVGVKTFHFGPVGRAADVKLSMNLLVAVMVEAMVEAMVFAKAAGVEMDTWEEAFRAHLAWSGLADLKVPRIRSGDFEPHFALKHMWKDMRLTALRAQEMGLDLPAMRQIELLLSQASEAGLADRDFSALQCLIAARSKQTGKVATAR